MYTRLLKRPVELGQSFFLFDAGVYRAIRPLGPLDAPEEAAGAGLETLCFQELLAVNDTLGLDYQLYYWRTADGTEVDFVLYGERGLLAFEVKRASRVTTADSAGLRALRREYPMAKCHLLYGGSRAWHEDGISILPLAQALPRLPTILAEG